MSRGRNSPSRRKPYRDPGKLLLIVCEGKKTEPNYFHEIRISKRLSSLSIEIVRGDIAGTHPTSIVQYAKQEKAKKKRQGLKYDQVWCVFDRDDHARIHEAFDQARANQMETAFSNPCFEIWLLLHFTLQAGYIDRHMTLSRLKTYIPEYEKGMDGIYAKLSDKIFIAMQNAEELRKVHVKNQNRDTENPSTTVDKLISYLEGFKS